MNYRHAFHAGNFADVFKHVVFVRVLVYLQRKPAPLRVIDTHAGAGRYDLAGEAARTAEWREGIGRLDPDAMEPQARALLEPYLALAGAAPHGQPYPGSPALALAFARPFDRLLFCETQPAPLAALRALVGRDKRAKVIALDGYTGLHAFVPPVERRGVVLIDPPFEAADEFERLAAGLLAAWRKWREGTYLAWFPCKDRRGLEYLAATLAGARVPDVLRLEFAVDHAAANGPLAACGMVAINPPWTLEAEMACLLPALARQLGRGHGASRVARVTPAP